MVGPVNLLGKGQKDTRHKEKYGYSSEMQDMLTEEMTGILIWAVVVVIIVMLISTKAYMLIPVLFLMSK